MSSDIRRLDAGLLNIMPLQDLKKKAVEETVAMPVTTYTRKKANGLITTKCSTPNSVTQANALGKAVQPAGLWSMSEIACYDSFCAN